MKRLKLIEEVPGYQKDTIYTWDEEREEYRTEEAVPQGTAVLPANWPKQYPTWFEKVPPDKKE